MILKRLCDMRELHIMKAEKKRLEKGKPVRPENIQKMDDHRYPDFVRGFVFNLLL